MNGGTYARLLATSARFTKAANVRRAAQFSVKKQKTPSDALLKMVADAKAEERYRLDELLSAAEGVRAALARREPPAPHQGAPVESRQHDPEI